MSHKLFSTLQSCTVLISAHLFHGRMTARLRSQRLSFSSRLAVQTKVVESTVRATWTCQNQVFGRNDHEAR